mmetsp:Transcript_6837/g.8335  ORF Transcript_6837/g.8335 Transcript_6837/m.8335 type:complete len:332 (+) Transcript_6837:118-1113(+)
MIELGLGHAVEVGDVCLAIGNNLGLQGTVTQGIISAVGRFMDNKQPDSSRRTAARSKLRVPLIQTSASINPGSSGGALVDMNGHLIGINTAIVTPSRGNVGLAFAVPANYILPILAAVDANEPSIKRPFIGLTLGQNPWPKKGILVHGVMRDGPAGRAGVLAKDIILKLNNTPTLDSDRFLMMIALQNIGSSVQLKVDRNGQEKMISITIGVWKPAKDKLLVVKDETNPLDGTTLAEMNPGLNGELGLDPQLQGVVVLKVAGGSSAAGLFQTGDRILKIGTSTIKTLEDLTRAVEKNIGKLSAATTLKIRVARGSVVIEFRLSLRPLKSKL